jgi:hypothetical protein
MTLVAKKNDLSLHEQIPYVFYLGIRRARQINTVNNDTNTGRERLDFHAGAGDCSLLGMEDLGVAVTNRPCDIGSIRFVIDHTVRVGTRPAGRIFLPVSTPGVRATSNPAILTGLGSIHSAGPKNLFHRSSHS